jgi:hypothetical protein
MKVKILLLIFSIGFQEIIKAENSTEKSILRTIIANKITSEPLVPVAHVKSQINNVNGTSEKNSQ